MGNDKRELLESPFPIQNREQIFKILQGLFNFRHSLLTQNGSVEELELTNTTLGYWLWYLSEWSGVHEVMGQCYLKGLVDNRGTVLSLLAPVYERIDTLHQQEQESLSNTPIIGIVGRIAAGKGTVGDILKELYHGFHFPLSDRLREYAQAEGFLPPFSREQLREIDAKLKPRFGKHVFIDWTLQTSRRLIEMYRPGIISLDGFRSVEESQWFLEQPNTSLVSVVVHPDPKTDLELRYQRIRNRMRSGEDPPTFEAFCQMDEFEQKWINPIMVLSEHSFINSGDINALKQQVTDYFKEKVFIKK